MPSNLYYWWMNAEFQDGGLNKTSVNIYLYSHLGAFLYHQKLKNTHNNLNYYTTIIA